MANKKIYKNRLSLPIFDNKGMGNGNGVAYVPNIIRGGSAIPIGNNMFFMKGKSHNQGGIDIGKDLEVERNEVVQNGKFGTRVFSSVPFLRGVSPAQRVLQGENPDAVFAAQENWKRINKINDDGSRKARKGKYITNSNVVQSDNTRVAPILNNTPKSKEIRQGDFVYTPKQLVPDDEKGFAWQPASKRVSQIPLETIYPEFYLAMGASGLLRGAGNLSKAIDVADVVSEPTNVFNYTPFIKLKLPNQNKAAQNFIESNKPKYSLENKIKGFLPVNEKLSPNYVNVGESSGNVIELPEFTKTQIDETRNWLKTFNKWNRRYGYEPIPLSASANPRKADELIKNRLLEHNTFIRGVTDYEPAKKEINELLAKEGLAPSAENRLRFMATHYMPHTGRGRAGYIPSESGFGPLYVSNTLDNGFGYARYIRDSKGKLLPKYKSGVYVVRRNVDLSGNNRNNWLLNAEFAFRGRKRSENYLKYQLPYLLTTGRSVVSEASRMPTKEELKAAKDKLNSRVYSNLIGIKLNDGIGSKKLNKQLTALAESSKNNPELPLPGFYFNGDVTNDYVNYRILGQYRNAYDRLRFLKEDLKRYKETGELDDPSLPFGNFSSVYNSLPEAIKDTEKQIKQTIGYSRFMSSRKGKEKLRKELNYYRDNILKRNSLKHMFAPTLEEIEKLVKNSHTPIKDIKPENLVQTSERLTSSSRNVGNPFQHFIFEGPENTKGLEIVKKITPDMVKDINVHPTTDHIGKYYKGMSRKTKQIGGRIKSALGTNLFTPTSFKVQELPIDSFLANSINREIETPEVPTYVLKDDEKPVGKKVNPNIIGGGRLYNGYAVDNHEKENVNGIGGGRVYTARPIDEFATDSVSFGDIKSPRGFKEQDADYIYDYLSKHSDLTDTAKAAILATAAFESGMNPRAKNKYSTAKGYFQWLDDRYIPTPGLSDEQEKIAQLNKIIDDMTPVKGKAKGWTQTKTRNIFDLANEFRTTDDIDRAVEIITRHHIRPSLSEEPRKNKQGVEVDKGYKWEIAERRKVAKQFYNRMFNRKNKKEFGGEDKVYIPPKWAQDSYKKYGKVVIGGEPLGIGLGVGRVGTFTGLMRNNLLRSAFRNFKKYGSRASTIIKDSYYDLTDALAKPFIRSEKAHKTFRKVRGIGYDTFFGDRRLDGTVKTGKGDFEFFSNLSRLPITFNETNNIINGEKEFGGMKLNIFKLGGLSRSKDYGSKDKPYPSVNKNDFAGGGRSYPIPTRADAVDALRLAGLHHRSDVRAKVYAKYPDLRKKAAAGTDVKFDVYNGTPNNNDGLVVGDNLSFNQAFGTARRAGFHTFTWRGKKYTTELADSSVDKNTYEGGTLPDLVVTGNRGRNANTILLREQNEDKLNENNKTPIIAENNTSNKKQSNSSAGLNSKIIDIIAGSTVGKWFRNKKFNWTPTPRENYNPAEHPSRNIFVEGMKKQIEFNDALKRDWDKYKESRKNNSIRTNVLGRREIPTPGTFGGGEFGGGGAGSRFGNPTEVQEDKYELIPVPVATRRTFNEAFADARKKGLKTFDFNGKKYTTELGNNPKSQSAGNRRYEDRLDIALIPRKKENKNRKGTNEDIAKNTNRRLVNSVSTRFAFGGRAKAPVGTWLRNLDELSDEEKNYIRNNATTKDIEDFRKAAASANYENNVKSIANRILNRPEYTEVNNVKGAHFDDYDYRRNTELVSPFNNPLSRFRNLTTYEGGTLPDLVVTANRPNSPRRIVTNTSRGRNTNSEVSRAAQRILDNAELAPYQNFSHPTLAEVAGRYPISERVGSNTSVTPISSSTGNGINPADVEAVRSGNFKAIDNDRYVPIHTTTEDWVGLGANLLGSIGSYLGTRAMLNRYPMPSKPVPAIAQKLKTRFNINSALDQIREQAGTLGRMVDNNTANSRVAQARKQGISNNATASTNQQYNQKENIKTQLINQDIMNRQRVGLYNNQVYNNWLSNRDAVRQYVANAKIGNFNNVLSGANQSIQDLLGRVESRDALGRNLIFMQAAYPNVNWRNIFQNNRELARSFGFRFLNN